MGELYQGAVAPESFVLGVQAGDSGLDLTTVSAAVMKVLKPGGVAVDWAAVISGATAGALTLTHSFATPTELDVPGDYVVFALLTVPGGFVTTDRILKQVRPKYSVVK
jgi:hypothetical protein